MRRLRQYRKDEQTRDQNAEVILKTEDLIYPYFVVEGQHIKNPIPSLHGIHHFSVDELLKDLWETVHLGIDKILLFGVVNDSLKDHYGTSAYKNHNLVSRTVREIKNTFPGLTVITDVCLCGYTSHGHCGLIKGETVDNDSTIPLLAQMALTHAEAGADIVAPSAMMDGQVQTIRQLLDEKGYQHTKILGYSAKYASGFYGPFRDAAHSAPSFGDRRSYQMDYRTINQALEEVAADIEEGANLVMVKPAHTYLDVIQRVKRLFPGVSLVAYHVSGEYMMIKAAAEAGFMEETRAMIEALTAIKRAGADFIITYYATAFSRMNDVSKVNHESRHIESVRT